jgi:probable rRNA maturation factor
VFDSIAKFAKVNLNDWTVAVELVDQSRMRLLNFKHRGMNKTTDVLSFKLNDYSPKDFCREDGGPLGEIIVCLPHVLQRYNRTNPRILDRRLERLFVHGFAHLMGYDHNVAPEYRRMISFESYLLRRLYQSQSVPHRLINRSVYFYYKRVSKL